MAEIGLVLSVLPLLISAVEHYEDCWRPLVRYSKFASKVDHFQRKFKVQKTIFRNECRLLLESVLEDSIARHMLEDSSHMNWTSKAIEEKVAEALDYSRDGCIEIITQIEEQLKLIEKTSRGFDEVIQGSHIDDQSIIGQKALRKIAKKLKFSFSESRLDDILTDLKALNDDFHRLSDQTSRLEGHRSRICRKSSSNSLQGPSFEKFRIIQEASKHAYGALSNSCTKHTEHLTHFCLEATTLDDAPTAQVRFKLAFTHVLLSGNLTPGDPAWILIESIVDGAKDSSNKPNQLSQGALSLVETLKRQNEVSIENCAKKAKKSVRFQAAASVCRSPSICVNPVSLNLRNLCVRKNFCDQLRNILQSPHTDKCVGMLDEIDSYKHLIYFPPSSPRRAHRQSTSLKQIITSLSTKGSLRRFPQYERIHLARSLATAVLQYHATPWLKGSWRSEDICFFGFDEKSLTQESPILSAPHLNVPVKGSNSSVTSAPNFLSNGFIRNPVLFGLGVVLLEIGYTKTLRELQQPKDRQDDNNRFTEFFTATRLAGSIGRELGSSYREIVTKCLHCDFGCGDDLNEPKLQAAFHQDVVKELEKLEEGFRALQLGP